MTRWSVMRKNVVVTGSSYTPVLVNRWLKTSSPEILVFKEPRGE